MYEYTPNERIVDRAVAIWVELLTKPKYDNLGKNSGESATSQMQNTMASVLAERCPKNNTSDVLTRFAKELKPFLMEPTEYTTVNYKKETVTEKRMFNYLSVDYHPDIPLAMAAERAGLTMQFPWKTSMFIDNNYVSVSNGYGAERIYHYPLSNDRWLAAAISGDDVVKIIKLVEDGVLDLELNQIK
jgi:hypothetical protein